MSVGFVRARSRSGALVFMTSRSWQLAVTSIDASTTPLVILFMIRQFSPLESDLESRGNGSGIRIIERVVTLEHRTNFGVEAFVIRDCEQITANQAQRKTVGDVPQPDPLQHLGTDAVLQ